MYHALGIICGLAWVSPYPSWCIRLSSPLFSSCSLGTPSVVLAWGHRGQEETDMASGELLLRSMTGKKGWDTVASLS